MNSVQRLATRGLGWRTPATLVVAALLGVLCPLGLRGQDSTSANNNYVLGPGDQISVHVTDVEEFGDKPVRVELDGAIHLPLIGRVRAGGMTVPDLEAEIQAALKQYVRAPEVTVSVAEFRSQPISVIGSVKNPGVHQLEGRKTLVEALAMAGGLADDAGYSVKITRSLEWGCIPLPGAIENSNQGYSVASVSVKGILEASNPADNILIKPGDVISVPRAEMVYVTGQVHRSGGFVLNGRQSMTVLQALSLAGGLDSAAAAQHTRILRAAEGSAEREEIPVNLSRIMSGKDKDVELHREDILFIPSSLPKRASIRAIEAAIQLGTGVLIWR